MNIRDGQAPSDVELRGLVDSYVLEEVLYRVALTMGLDQDDAIVRRRMRQKIEFRLDDFTLVVAVLYSIFLRVSFSKRLSIAVPDQLRRQDG